MTDWAKAGRAAALSLIAASAVAPSAALAQAVDPIGDILGKMTPEMEEPDVAAEPFAPHPDPEAALPAAPVPYSRPNSASGPYRPSPYVPKSYAPQAYPPQAYSRPPPVTTGEPVMLDEVGKSPEGPRSVQDLAYESRLRASFASAQGFQGPMDGSWVLADAYGREIYALQLADKGRGEVEGAWRDARRPGQPGASGFIDDVRRTGGGLQISFQPAGGRAVTASLQGTGTQFSGQLDEAGHRQNVTLKKRAQP